ncbi:hypothetical protein LOD99_3312 [Oopsacas minuta]|uniref:Uncharacterized protein n=1 Tax=Oopsacas minuta TaxID=111878 RepID=A0AAV7JZL9_9METZ|nr:hypothetical protein LOD99_3312 [Oopsacas minuta]
MSLLSCNCLNVQIPVEREILPEPFFHTQLLPERDYNTLHSLVSEKENHIFSSKLIQLDVSPTKTIIRVDSLTGIQKLGNWVVVRCLNCHTDCYMFDKTRHTASLYVLNKLTYNPEIIRGLSDCNDLSPAFGIVIRSNPQIRMVPDHDIEVIEVLRHRVSEFITQAKHESDEKLKDFNEKEAKRISALERRAWSDFKHVISNIETESIQVSPLSLSPPENSPQQISPDSPKTGFPNTQLPLLSDSDDLPFELDGFSTDNTRPHFLESSDEDEDSDSRSETSSVENLAHVSRSMPISFAHSPLHDRVNDLKVEHINLDDIHTSMKILAQSVTDPHYRDLPLPGHYQRSANHI